MTDDWSDWESPGTTYEELLELRDRVDELEEKFEAIRPVLEVLLDEERADRLEATFETARERIDERVEDLEDGHEADAEAEGEHADPFIRAARKTREWPLTSSDVGGDDDEE